MNSLDNIYALPNDCLLEIISNLNQDDKKNLLFLSKLFQSLSLTEARSFKRFSQI